MSGTRHHHIPQFLLRGFAKRRGREAYAWVFRHGKEPYNSNVLNIAVEGHFYTHDGTSEVDDLITDAEGHFGKVVELLRSSKSAESVPTNELAALLTHLEVRTRHLRRNFEFVAEHLIHKSIDLMTDERRLTDFMLRRLAADPVYVLDDLKKELLSRGVGDPQASLAVAAIAPHLPRLLPQFIPGAAEDMARAFRTFLTNNATALKEMVRNAQLRALKAGVAPAAKADLYRDMTFRVVSHACSLPLGDSAVVASVQNSAQFKSFLNGDDRVNAVYLPLTSSLALCAHRRDFDPYSVDLPRAVARCSFDSFIAPETTPALYALRQEIAVDAMFMSEEALQGALDDAFEEAKLGSNGQRGIAEA